MLNSHMCPQIADQLRKRRVLFTGVLDPCQWEADAAPAVNHDITTNLDQLLQLGTWSNVGKMAAGIVHDIRNPLASLKGFLQMLGLEWQGSDCGREYIDIMLEAIEELNGIAGELLYLSRPRQPVRENCNPGELIREIAGLLRGQALIHDIDVQCVSVPTTVPDTLADSKHLKQAILNLTSNAIQAMPRGGRVIITSTYLKDANGYVLEVIDNGSGIDEQILPHIFTPFFSTKGQGGGLGLHLVERIVEEHGGNIKVSSYPGRGTTFRIWMPRIAPI
ncbi:MAG: two-component system sensor histidine kinase NtrB [Methylocystaceae bacterium]